MFALPTEAAIRWMFQPLPKSTFEPLRCRLPGSRLPARFAEAVLKVISYRTQGKSGVGVVTGANGVIALSKAAPALPDDLLKILQVDPTIGPCPRPTPWKTGALCSNITKRRS